MLSVAAVVVVVVVVVKSRLPSPPAVRAVIELNRESRSFPVNRLGSAAGVGQFERFLVEAGMHQFRIESE